MTELFILTGLIVVNGLFALAEITLVSARKTRLELLSKNGSKKAKAALHLSENPEIFLSSVQIGITLISIFTGLYSGEKFSKDLTPILEQFSLIREYAQPLSTTIIVIGVTLVSIILGELIPKRLGLIHSEKIAVALAVPMLYFSRIVHPIVWFLNKSTNLFFKIFRIKHAPDNQVTEEEIKAIISEGTE